MADITAPLLPEESVTPQNDANNRLAHLQERRSSIDVDLCPRIEYHRHKAALTRSRVKLVIQVYMYRKETRKKRVLGPPGYWLARFARAVLIDDGFRRYVQPMVADMQHEYMESLAAGHKEKANWVLFRGYLFVFPASIYALWSCLVRRILKA